VVSGVPLEYHGASGVWTGYVRDAVYAHNTISTCPNGCFELGWGWGSNVSYAGNNTIDSNHIVRSNWLMEDCGSIYVNGMQATPSRMTRNYCEQQVLKYGALYPDEGSSNWLLSQNVVHSVPEWLHIWTTSIHDITVADNWSDQTYQVENVRARACEGVRARACGRVRQRATACEREPASRASPLLSPARSVSQGVNITLVNNTFIQPGSPFPAAAQAIMAAAGAQW